MSARTESQIAESARHIYHVWINRRQEAISGSGTPREHSLYEFKDLLRFLEYGWEQIKKAYTGDLRKVHQQCSRTAPEAIENNCLKCCLGVDVTKCDILVSIKVVFDEERSRTCGELGNFYEDVPDEQMYRYMAQTCAWHIYKNVTNHGEGFHGVDTSEGHLMDVSDRMYWSNLYASMAGSDGDPSEEGESK